MKVVKTVKEARANFDAATATIPARYAAGVAKGEWAEAAASDQAEENYATRVGEAIAKKTRQLKCREVGDTAWRDGAIKKGQPIIGARIKMSLDKWERNFGPVYDRVVALLPRLPARTVDFRTNINNRLVAVVEEWKKASGKL